MGGVSGLLRSGQVQEELKLTDDQKSELGELAQQQFAEMRERFAGRRQENPEELSEDERQAQREKMMKEFQERAKIMEEKIRAILEPKQFKRVKQIELQQMGAMAFTRPDVAQALKMTEEQKQEMKELFEDVQKKRQEIGQQTGALFQGFREASDEDREKMREKMEQFRAQGEALNKETQQKAMALITDEQKGMLKNLMGEPFKLERPAMPGRPGGPRQGGAPGRQRRDGNRRPQRPQS